MTKETNSLIERADVARREVAQILARAIVDHGLTTLQQTNKANPDAN